MSDAGAQTASQAGRPYPSMTKLTHLSRKAGHVVSHEEGTTTIESTDVVLTLGPEGSITDAAGNAYTGEQAYAALDIPLA